MDTIKVKTTLVEKKEIEKEFPNPYYSKTGNYHYKMTTEDDDIWVNEIWLCAGNAAIGYRNSHITLNEVIEAKPCTEAEFNEAFKNALDIISKNVGLLVSVSELPQPQDFEMKITGEIKL